jgi:hypothetical protein
VSAGDRIAVAAFMLVTIASGGSGAVGYDTTRDVAAAYAIVADGARPLTGPLFGSTFHLGPVWFYVLAIPLALHASWLAPSLFVAALASLQFPLAYAAGRRLVDRRLGLLWCALLALPGWGSFLLVGFAHTNAVPVTVMLLIYTLVRLARDGHPAWLAAAGATLALAIHAHPSTAALAPVVAVVAVRRLRDVGVLLRWGGLALAAFALPFAPALYAWLAAPSSTLARSGEYVEGMVRLANLANVPALFAGVLVRGPRVVADAFAAPLPAGPQLVYVATLAVEFAAVTGLAFAWRRQRNLVIAALAALALVGLAVALIRPVTPFYMTYALLPLVAGAGALGLCAWCTKADPRGGVLSAMFVGTLLLLHIATTFGIAATIASGHVSVPVISRLDVKQDAPLPSAPEPWAPAWAIDASGVWLCAQRGPVVLHGTYASLEDTYLGLDQRLHCGGRDVRLLGADAAPAAHHVGLALPLWNALGRTPPVKLGGLGVAPVARVLNPITGFAVPDGRVYPPHAPATGAARRVELTATLPAGEAVIVSQPYALWTAPPTIGVTANGNAQAPLANDAVSAVYLCRACARDAPVEWRIGIDAVEPERVDVVTLAAP